MSYQQIQKYEQGLNALTVERLFQMAEALDLPLAYLIDGFGEAKSRLTVGVALEARELRHIQRLRTVSDEVRAAIERLVSDVAQKRESRTSTD
jgi:transcriptional regulator with XRE-family HTH domain